MSDSVFSSAAELADRFTRRWKHDGENTEAFGALAVETLQDSELATTFSADAVTASLERLTAMPAQQSAGNFGQPPLTLFTDRERAFFIELYLWSSTDMGIHDHAFRGAFAVVEGSCVNQRFSFRSTDDAAASLRAGELLAEDFDEMPAGSVREITHDLLHRNLHLARPTVTLVLRTFGDLDRQHLYYEPGLALDGAITPDAYKQLQWLEGLLRLDEAKGRSFCERVAGAAGNAAHAFRAVELYLRKTERWEDIDELVDTSAALSEQREAVHAALTHIAQGEPTIKELLERHPRASSAA